MGGTLFLKSRPYNRLEIVYPTLNPAYNYGRENVNIYTSSAHWATCMPEDSEVEQTT